MLQNFFSELYQELKYFYLSREEKALTYTFVVLIVVFFCLIIFQIGTPIDKEIAFEIDVQSLPTPQEEIQNVPPFDASQATLTTQAYNTANHSLEHVEKFKSLEEILQEQQLVDATAAADATALTPTEDSTSEATSDNSELTEKKSTEFGNEVNKNALVTYFLEGRHAIRALPNPIYTCEVSGEIVIDIVVNEQGRVIKASFNKELSSTKNNCLVSNALVYAQQAVFSSSEQSKQKGIITYYYQPKNF